MKLSELKKLAYQGRPEVHILSNEGDLYLIQVFSDGKQALITDSHGQNRVFHALPECYETLADIGVHKAYVDQIMAYDEMVSCNAEQASHTDHRAVVF